MSLHSRVSLGRILLHYQIIVADIQAVLGHASAGSPPHSSFKMVYILFPSRKITSQITSCRFTSRQNFWASLRAYAKVLLRACQYGDYRLVSVSSAVMYSVIQLTRCSLIVWNFQMFSAGFGRYRQFLSIDWASNYYLIDALIRFPVSVSIC